TNWRHLDTLMQSQTEEAMLRQYLRNWKHGRNALTFNHCGWQRSVLPLMIRIGPSHSSKTPTRIEQAGWFTSMSTRCSTGFGLIQGSPHSSKKLVIDLGSPRKSVSSVT